MLAAPFLGTIVTMGYSSPYESWFDVCVCVCVCVCAYLFMYLLYLLPVSDRLR